MKKCSPTTKDPLSPFLWRQRKESSIFANDHRFAKKFKTPSTELSALHTYSKAQNGNS
jgi:hypothetical protein